MKYILFIIGDNNRKVSFDCENLENKRKMVGKFFQQKKNNKLCNVYEKSIKKHLIKKVIWFFLDGI